MLTITFVMKLKDNSNEFKDVTDKLKRSKRNISDKQMILDIYDKYGKLGVQRLKEKTPVKNGDLANAWGYIIEDDGDNIRLTFYNDILTSRGMSVALLLDTGHATRNGGWVEGRDYISPALQPVIDELANELFSQVFEFRKGKS